MTASFTKAVRSGVGLLIGIAGASSSGKTFSALRLARGLAGGNDDKIAFIDTEAGRALHYAPVAGAKPDAHSFGFQHAELNAPFTPEAYTQAIVAADEAGFKVIVIDSFSHVWAGTGGLQDMHAENVEKAVEKARQRHNGNYAFNEDRERDKASIGAWNEPKQRHKRMVTRLLQCRAHIIICLRAEDKLRMEVKEETGRGGQTYKKTEITPAEQIPHHKRWVPVCEKRLPYELLTLLVVTPDEPGKPYPVKFQDQLEKIIPLDRKLDEETGRRLAEWSSGSKMPVDAPHERQPDSGEAAPEKPTASPRPVLEKLHDQLSECVSADMWKNVVGNNRAALEELPEQAKVSARRITELHKQRILQSIETADAINACNDELELW